MADLFDQPAIVKLGALLDNLRTGSLLIPDFQRRFVWTDEQRLNLLRSIADGLPIGSLLVWSSNDPDVATVDALGPHALPGRAAQGPWLYLIDGLQRLTTLFLALTPPPEERHAPSRTPQELLPWGDDGGPFDDDAGAETAAAEPPRRILIDLNATADQRFVLEARHTRVSPTRVPAEVLLSRRALYAAQKALWAESKNREADAIEALADRFQDYQVPVMRLFTSNVEDVARAFARINSGGTKMTEADLAAALAYRRLPLAQELDALASSLREAGWHDIDRGALLDLLKLRFGLDVYRSELPALLEQLGAGRGAGADAPERRARFNVIIDELSRSVWLAVAGLQRLGVRGSHALPYRFQLLVLAEALRRYSPPGRLGHLRTQYAMERWLPRVELWFWQTTLLERFTGATGRTIMVALDGLVGVLTGESSPYSGQAVVPSRRHQRFGAVRTRARLLALIADDEVAQEHLALAGPDAIVRIDPAAPKELPGSWLVATRHDVQEVRDALSAGAPPSRTSLAARQLSPAAKGALARGDVAAAVEAQCAHMEEIERRLIREAQLELSEG
ncbi:MAG: DUF262 domain-containing protein [Deltaproteobacteria bacterium]|nr:DUF262 domain-containing protein [Deltaproteobacteria bacterium]